MSIDKSTIEKDSLDINEDLGPIKPFPIEIFPNEMQSIIQSLNECLDFPTDYIGSSILYAASLSIGNAYKVEVKRGWTESAVLYIAISGRAGTNKSAPLSWALNPIKRQDQKSHKIYLEKLKYYEQAKEMSKKERSEAGIDEPEKPVLRKYLLSDFTPEALTQVHEGNLRGIGIHADELASWFNNFNRYSKGSEQQFWLSIWSGKAINVDRKGGRPVYIASPHIPVIGTLQTALVSQLATDGRDQNGFIDRILFVINPMIKKPYWSDIELDENVTIKYRAIMQHILDLPYDIDEDGNYQSQILKYSPEAKEVLYSWQRNNADECNVSESDSKAQILSKLEIYISRFALIIEVLDKAPEGFTPTAISVDSIHKAIKLVEYFRSTALWVLQTINKSIGPIESLSVQKRRIYDKLSDEFSTKEAIAIGEENGLKKRAVQEFLRDRSLFSRVKQGQYRKAAINESAQSAAKVQQSE